MKTKLRPYIYISEILLIFFAVILILLTVGTYLYFANTLVSKDKIMNNNDTGLVLMDREKRPFFTFFEGKNREIVPLSNISHFVPEAVIASEDKEFYQHKGFSVRAIVRSIFRNFEKRDLSYGGSTITQQLVKNALLNSEKSFLRKYQELVLAREIERRFTKNEIMEMYLNSVYFGEGAFGIEEAAKRYFGTNAKDLNLSEASFLAGILPAPSLYSPYNGGLQEAKKRQDLVLSEMKSMNFINQKEENIAKSQKLVFSTTTRDINNTAPHFALMIRDFLIDKYGEEAVIRRGLKVVTTIDINLQEYAERSIRQNVERLRANNVTNGAAVIMDIKNREVLALVGSTDWFNNVFGKINMAMSPRQPGSSFKPIVYATAFEKGVITNATQLHDTPIVFHENGPNSPEYKPKDYDGKYRGIVLPRRALANSLNIPSVEVMSKLSVAEVLDKAHEAGISTLKDPSNYGLSLVLGTGEIPLFEMTNAYATLADYGIYKNPVTVTYISDKNGKSIFKASSEKRQAFEPEAAYIVTNILSDNKARQEVFGNALTVPFPAAVKTGTTENYRDALTLGYTPYITVGVWVGNSNGEPMDSVAGSLGAAPIWKDLIMYTSRNKPAVSFRRPQNIILSSTCIFFGGAKNTATSSAITEYFISGTEPPNRCQSNVLPSIPTPFVSQVVTATPTPSPEVLPSQEDKTGKNTKNEIEKRLQDKLKL